MSSAGLEPRSALSEAKRTLRSSLKTTLRSLDSKQMDEKSSKIALKVLELPLFVKAQKVGLYIHCPRLNEVNTSWIVAEALNQGKECFTPRVVDRNAHMELLHIESDKDLIEMPPYGILEPSGKYLTSQEPRINALDAGLDLLLVPGMGFDRYGGRLGRGGGYYDNFISRCLTACEAKDRPPPALVGLAFDCQVLSDRVPTGPSDQRIDYLLTEKRSFECTKERNELERTTQTKFNSSSSSFS